MTRTREEAEKWLAEEFDTAYLNWLAKVGKPSNLKAAIARALLDAGVTVPEPKEPRYYADRQYVRDLEVEVPFTNGSKAVVCTFYDGHPLGKETAAQAEADRLNGTTPTIGCDGGGLVTVRVPNEVAGDVVSGIIRDLGELARRVRAAEGGAR